MLVTVVLKNIASINTNPKNTVLSYLEQILNQNLFLYLRNLNLYTSSNVTIITGAKTDRLLNKYNVHVTLSKNNIC